MFNVYTGIRFSSLVPDWKGISTSIVIDAPPGCARSHAAGRRVAFWESMSGKCLSQGGLIALVWQSGRRTTVHLGIIASSSKELTEFVRQNMDYIKLRIVFFDPEIELRILQELQNNKTQQSRLDIKLLVESPVMFETFSIRSSNRARGCSFFPLSCPPAFWPAQCDQPPATTIHSPSEFQVPTCFFI